MAQPYTCILIIMLTDSDLPPICHTKVNERRPSTTPTTGPRNHAQPQVPAGAVPARGDRELGDCEAGAGVACFAGLL